MNSSSNKDIVMKFFLGTLLFFATQLSVYADEQTKAIKPSTFDYRAASAAAFEIAPVKSKKDLLKVMNGPSALDLLSEQGRQLFVESLVFTKKSLASYNYQVLTDELNEQQIFQVLSLFGAQYSLRQSDTADDQPLAPIFISNLALAAPLPPSDTVVCGNSIEALKNQFNAIRDDSFSVVVSSQENNRAEAHFQRCYLPQAKQLTEQAPPLQHASYLSGLLYMADSQAAYHQAKQINWPKQGPKIQLLATELVEMAILARDYEWAQQLVSQYQLQPEILNGSLPPPVPATAGQTPGRLVLAGPPGQQQWQHFRFPKGPAVILVTRDGCGFSANFQRYLSTQPKLAQLFQQYSLQIAGVGYQLSSNPAILDIYQTQQWPEIDYWGTPAFYFYQDGRLQGSLLGWPKEGRVAELQQMLTRIGL
jgi:hypothetical protein